MKSKIAALFLVLFCVSALALFADEPISGTYQGQLVSDGEYLDTVTTFSPRKGGKIVGSYVFTEADGRDVEGTLSLLKQEASLVYLFAYKDEYGEGYVRLLFSSDLSTFSGYWGNDLDDISYPWNGSLSQGDE